MRILKDPELTQVHGGNYPLEYIGVTLTSGLLSVMLFNLLLGLDSAFLQKTQNDCNHSLSFISAGSLFGGALIGLLAYGMGAALKERASLRAHTPLLIN